MNILWQIVRSLYDKRIHAADSRNSHPMHTMIDHSKIFSFFRSGVQNGTKPSKTKILTRVCKEN